MRNWVFFSLLLLCFSSCQDEPGTDVATISQSEQVQLQILAIENAIWQQDTKVAFLEANGLLSDLQKDQGSHQVELQAALISELEGVAKALIKKDTKLAAKLLRGVKASLVLSEQNDNIDPYIFMLWRFEADMSPTVKIAKDPMLELLEWGEFICYVDEMNESWRALDNHYPSPYLLDYDEVKYRDQTMLKVGLANAVKSFYQAIESNNYLEHNLCDAAHNLELAYHEYIKVFLGRYQDSDMFLSLN